MKSIKIILFVLFSISYMNNTDAQLLKKLKDRIEKKVTQKVEDKIDRKTDEVTDSALSKLETPGILFGGKTNPPLSQYSFNYEIRYQIYSGQNSSNITYLVNDKMEYFANKIEDKSGYEIYNVFDQPNETMHMFMNNHKNRTVMSQGINMRGLSNKAVSSSDLKIVELPEKKEILGHMCIGYSVTGIIPNTNEHFTSEVWVLKNPPVSFTHILGFQGSRDFGDIDKRYNDAIPGLVLEMTTETYKVNNRGLKRNVKDVEMICTSFGLLPAMFVINSSDYAKL